MPDFPDLSINKVQPTKTPDFKGNQRVKSTIQPTEDIVQFNSMGSTVAESKAINIAKEIQGNRNEVAYILDSNGDTIFTKDGNTKEISFNLLDIIKLKAKGKWLVHNHPTHLPEMKTYHGNLSQQDLLFALDNKVNIISSSLSGMYYFRVPDKFPDNYSKKQAMADIENLNVKSNDEYYQEVAKISMKIWGLNPDYTKDVLKNGKNYGFLPWNDSQIRRIEY